MRAGGVRFGAAVLGRGGIPDNPAAWLTTAARRRAIDAIRRDSALRARLPLLVEPETEPGSGVRRRTREPWYERQRREDPMNTAPRRRMTGCG